jgi:hypothetical protein
MLWFFDRDDESLKLETRYDNETSEFVAVVRYPNGVEHEKRFADAGEFRTWLQGFERDLALQRWTGRGGPVILAHGWPDEPLT